MPSLRENTFNVSTRSLKDPPEITRSAVAYVPYLHARNTLSRVIEDMKNMKMSHLAIVTEIEEQYKGIEIESRVSSLTFHLIVSVLYILFFAKGTI